MNAKQVIEKFGGQTALAKLLGKGQSTVGYWAQAGVIPAKWHSQVLSLAAAQGIELTVGELVGGGQAITQATPIRKELPPVFEAEEPFPERMALPSEDGIQTSPFIFYADDDGRVKVQIVVGGETVWASQRGMAEIFDVDVTTVNYHLKTIFQSGELDKQATVGSFPIVQTEGDRQVKRPNVEFYNLDAIISVGYRVNSHRATQFRRWATRVLKEYLTKGFVLDDERLKQGGKLFGRDYFDELLQRIREIRASERNFYQRITDLYAQTSADYDKDSEITHQFYQHVQDKLHYAVHGKTSAELVEARADARLPHMGLMSFKNAATGGKVTKADVTVGKNYLNPSELDELNRLVNMYLDFAEGFAKRRKLLTMKLWVEKLDDFLQFNEYNVLTNFGKVSREKANRHAIAEYDKFRVVQDREYRSDFDKVVEAAKSRRLPAEGESA